MTWVAVCKLTSRVSATTPTTSRRGPSWPPWRNRRPSGFWRGQSAAAVRSLITATERPRSRLVEQSPAAQRDAEGLEVVGIDQTDVRDGCLGELACVVLDRHRLHERFAAKRRVRDERRGATPGHGAQPVEQSIEELQARRPLPVLRGRQRQIGKDDVRDAEAGVDARQAQEAGGQERGQHQQDRAERNLRGHQRRAQPERSDALGDRAPGGVERGLRVRSGPDAMPAGRRRRDP